jgi:hypothetical protein
MKYVVSFLGEFGSRLKQPSWAIYVKAQNIQCRAVAGLSPPLSAVGDPPYAFVLESTGWCPIFVNLSRRCLQVINPALLGEAFAGPNKEVEGNVPLSGFP